MLLYHSAVFIYVLCALHCLLAIQRTTIMITIQDTSHM